MSFPLSFVDILMKIKFPICFALLALLSCTNGERKLEVEQWGELKPVVMMGQDQGRIALKEIQGRPNAYGLGALEGLAGEIIVLDGSVWHAQADSNGLVTNDHVDAGLQAALLVVANVPDWQSRTWAEPLAWGELEDKIGRAVHASDLNTKDPVPFLIEGEFSDLSLHVINGACPYRQEEGAPEPYRFASRNTVGTLFGFYYEGEPGILTHHGQRLHLHAFLPGDEPMVGQVDSVSLSSGCNLSLP